MRLKKFLAALVFFMLCACQANAENYIEGEALVVFRTSESVNASAIVTEASVMDTYEELSRSDGRVFVHVKSTTKTTEQLVAEFRNMPDVIAASPNHIYHNAAAQVIPNDEYFGRLWNLERVNVPEVWSKSTGSDTVYVAVMDSGVYPHEDLEENIDEELSNGYSGKVNWDHDIVGHGTHIAGTLGAVGNNGIGITGVNWNVRIIAMNICNAQGDTDDNSIIRALNHLAGLLNSNPDMKLAAINMSFGDYQSKTPEEKLNDTDYLAYKAINDMNRTLLVVAAGNAGLEVGAPAPFDYPEMLMERDGLEKPLFREGDYLYPPCFTGLNNMIVVGATDYDNDAPYYTNWGDSVDIAAPGSDIYSTYSPLAKDSDGNTGTMYISKSGTSMAAPHVTGAAALLAAAFPNATPQDIRNAMIRGANRRINPIVHPYARMLENFDEEDENEALIIDDIEPYSLLDGMGQVANQNSGLLDVNAAMGILAGNTSKYANVNTNYDSGGSCSLAGCGVALMLGLCVVLRGRSRS